MTTFFHRGSHGDIIYSLPTIIALGGGDICLSNGNQYDTLKPLLSTLPYIHSVFSQEKSKTKIDYDLDKFRQHAINETSLLLTRCHMKPFGVDYDLTQAWIDVEPKKVADVVVNVTPRYRHDRFDYSVLRWYDCVFIGKESEWTKFKNDTSLDLPYAPTSDGLEAAKIIRGSKIFVGNQSFCFSLAEAMKHPRILEVYSKMPNCMPQGADGHTILSKEVLEKYLKSPKIRFIKPKML